MNQRPHNDKFEIKLNRAKITERMFAQYICLFSPYSAVWNEGHLVDHPGDPYVDEGEITVFKDQKRLLVVDTKEAYNWIDHPFPWRYAKICKDYNWHVHWIYVMINTSMTAYILIKPRLVPDDQKHFEKTLTSDYNYPQNTVCVLHEEPWSTWKRFNAKFNMKPFQQELADYISIYKEIMDW